MAKGRKEFRELKVGALCNTSGNLIPSIRLNGMWVEELGFHIGDSVLIKCEDGKLIITPDRTRDELLEAEREAMKEIDKKYEQAKKALHAKMVAERRAEYAM